MDIEDLIDKILPCIEKHAGGRNKKTRQRRRVMLEFFAYTVAYAADVAPSAMVLAYDFPHHLNALGDGLDRRVEDAPVDANLAEEIYEELETSWRILSDEFLAASPETGNMIDVAPAARRTLQQFFDWEKPSHLRAYVYARTGEMMQRGLLDKERSQLLAVLRQCLEENES